MELKQKKSTYKYCCELCNYSTPRYSQYERHLSTKKHKDREEPDKTFYEPKNIKKVHQQKEKERLKYRGRTRSDRYFLWITGK